MTNPSSGGTETIAQHPVNYPTVSRDRYWYMMKYQIPALNRKIYRIGKVLHCFRFEIYINFTNT